MKKVCKNKSIDIILVLVAAAFAVWVNRQVKIMGLYMDDLYMWSCYGEQSLREFVLPIGTSTRFRPVYWLTTYLEMALIGTNVECFVAFNIMVNVLAAALIYFFVRRIVRSVSVGRAAGLVSMIAYLASRFAYYQIGQALGLMETEALILALVVLYGLYSFLTLGRHFYASLAAYFLLAFTHERYIALLPLFYLVLVLRRPAEKKKLRWAAPIVTLIVIILIRAYAIGSVIPAGTGGTEVTETFQIPEAVSYCLAQILYIFGVNAGPEYLCGITWADVSPFIKALVKLSAGSLAILVAIYTITVIIEAVGRRGERLRLSGTFARELRVGALFVAFIALCIGSSSVTIRLEMRWIYVSYAAALIYASYMVGRAAEHGRTAARLALAAWIAYGVLSVYTNVYYREYFPNIYFWENQERMNSLYLETIGRYGREGILGRDIYILENSYEMSDFYAETFFKPYDPDRETRDTRIIFAESIEDVPDGAIVLIEVPEERGYRDISELYE